MKNLDLLKTGAKPAPGELVIVQGFVNTLDVGTGADSIATKELLKAWLVRHGLLRLGATVSSQDLQTALRLREALRSLLLANNGETAAPSSQKQLNQLFARHTLAVFLERDGTPCLVSSGDGVDGALGQILAQMVKAVGEKSWFRLKACGEPSCAWAFYDSSKNHSGHWCAMSVCGSRYKARAYRRRQSGVRQKPASQ